MVRQSSWPISKSKNGGGELAANGSMVKEDVIDKPLSGTEAQPVPTKQERI